MSDSSNRQPPVRVALVRADVFRALAWIGPILLVLGTAVGSGEVLAEPAAGAKYGGKLLWAVVLIVITKAFWNEVVGRVSIVTGQNFLDTCSNAGPLVSWVPWAWYAVNGLKDFFLRGGIAALAGMICNDLCLELFGPLPLVSEDDQVKAWTLLNYGMMWVVLVAGGYRLVETLNTVLCLLFSMCLIACAAAVLPRAIGELAEGVLPSLPSQSDELLMMVALTGIVMSGSATVYYTAWAEERQMGLFGFARQLGRSLTPEEFQPQSEEEVRRMRRWVRVNRINVTLTYVLGALICLSTFVLGVAVLRPAGVTLKGEALARELSLMMTTVVGGWAKYVFYIGAWAALVSTSIGILDGGSRMYVQPVRQLAPRLFAKLSFGNWRIIVMTLMVGGCWTVYVLVPDALRLVVWMGAVDGPLVGFLMITYAYLGRWYLPAPYRSGRFWTIAMMLIGLLYFGLGVYLTLEKSGELIQKI